jgi:nucleolar protein 16
MSLCDSYDALGLVATLNPNESGGTEHKKYGSQEEETSPSTSTRGDPKGVAELSTGAKIPVGYGRILRDEQGNAVDIEFGDEDVEGMDTDRNEETMDAYVDEKSVTTWTQLGARTTTRTKRPNSVVEGMGRIK